MNISAFSKKTRIFLAPSRQWRIDNGLAACGGVCFGGFVILNAWPFTLSGIRAIELITGGVGEPALPVGFRVILRSKIY